MGNGEMKLNRYPKYKPTGIAWLPEVPEGWEVVSLGRLIDEPLSYGASETGEVENAPGFVRYIRITDITLDGKLKHDGCKYLAREKAEGVMLEKGDVLFARSGATVGKSYLFNEDIEACYAGYLIRASVRREKLLPEFLLYFSQSTNYEEWKNRIFIQATIQNISAAKYTRLTLPLPPLPTQRAIVAFLDEKCGKIDRWVAAKEREVALLKELKQAMIAEAVTRGFDHKVLNFSTGVFWQPLMPEGWCVKKCRHALQKLNRSRPKDAELLVCTNKGTVNKRGDAKIGLVSEDETIYQGVAAGDLLIHGMDTWHGAIAVSELDGMCTPVVHVCDSKENKKFVAFCFQNMARGRLFKLISNGVRQNTSDFRSWEKVAQLPLVLPPRKEQDRIVSYIEARAAKIDAAVAGLEREVAAMKEYKQRLIADVVTGQRKVA